MAIKFLTTGSCKIAAVFENLRETSNCRGDRKVDVIRPSPQGMPTSLVYTHSNYSSKFIAAIFLSLTSVNAGLFVCILKQ